MIISTQFLHRGFTGLFGAVGYTGFRYGYAQGVQITASGETPQLRPLDDFDPRGLHGFGMDREFQRGFGPGRVPMMGFGFFSPLRWLVPLVILALIALFVYWLVTRSGWRLTRQTTENVPPSPPENE